MHLDDKIIILADLGGLADLAEGRVYLLIF
jgi:hypothetical protein